MATYGIPPGLVTKAASEMGVGPDQVNTFLDARIADGTLAAMASLLLGNDLIEAEVFAVDHGLTTQDSVMLLRLLGIARGVRVYQV